MRRYPFLSGEGKVSRTMGDAAVGGGHPILREKPPTLRNGQCGSAEG